MSELKVHSGESCLCDIGIEVNAADQSGRMLHTGDIVLVWHGTHIDTYVEFWSSSCGLTVVVANQYQSYSNGDVKLRSNTPEPFVMGIKDCGFHDPSWRIQLVKKFHDVVDGEHWKEFGFSYRRNGAADAARTQNPEAA